jgi:hypothetical protein
MMEQRKRSSCASSTEKNPSSSFENPGRVDVGIRELIQLLWMAMPEGKRTITVVQAEFQRLVDRAFQNIQEDSERLDR